MTVADILATGGLRATSDTPVRYAVIDVMKAVLGDDVCPAQLCAMYGRLRKEHDLPQDFVFFRGGAAPITCLYSRAGRDAGTTPARATRCPVSSDRRPGD